MKEKKVLFVTTSHDNMGNNHGNTGVWLEELAAPYYIFKEAGAVITIASPKGGPVPIDPKSQSIIVVSYSGKSFLKDADAMSLLSHSLPLEEVTDLHFDLVFLSGGHGAMWDFVDNKILKQLLEAFNNTNKLIGSVCHGVAGLLSLKNENGEFLIKGKRLTAFSNTEEESTGRSKVVPFLLETELVSLGALYSKGENYVGYIVTDGNIITGQNPASAEEVARKIVALVRESKHISPSVVSVKTD